MGWYTEISRFLPPSKSWPKFLGMLNFSKKLEPLSIIKNLDIGYGSWMLKFWVLGKFDSQKILCSKNFKKSVLISYPSSLKKYKFVLILNTYLTWSRLYPTHVFFFYCWFGLRLIRKIRKTSPMKFWLNFTRNR